MIIALCVLERKAWWMDALQYSTHHFPGLPISQISPSICEVPRTFTHLTKPGNKEKSPPRPQLLKDTINLHVRMKPALLPHLSNRYSNYEVVFSEALKYPFLKSLKAGSFAELNNQDFLHVCYARSIDLRDMTWLPEDRTNIFLSKFLLKCMTQSSSSNERTICGIGDFYYTF